ncbi:MAG: phosphopentomutase [Fimbriimonadaceae bacterium]|nr:phosphopentomutase [Fimbriimonadaceae bacterium]
MRAVVVVMDGCGAGAAPDHAAFHDGEAVATLANVWRHCGGLDAPNLEKLGLFAAAGVGSSPGRFGRLRPLSQGKDSVTGHWEMAGVVTEVAFPTYPQGFPLALVKQFEEECGVQTLGNRPASGTQIIAELGEQHLETHCPILYTSADSVFQLAAHEEVVPVDKLYEWCRTARRLCVAPNNVQRIIARPFVGSPGAFKRTEHRKDFPLDPPQNLVDVIGDVAGVGVVPELFNARGFRAGRRTQNNAEHEGALFEALESDARFIFANFEDFDMLYGHRQDPDGFGRCLETFDKMLGRLLARLGDDDLLVITADHGNDPTDASTDHTREYSPVVLWSTALNAADMGDVDGLTAVGATVAAWLGVPWRDGTNLLGL